MLEPTRRHRFHIHLTTAVVLMFFVIWFVAENLTGRMLSVWESWSQPAGFAIHWLPEEPQYGWPFIVIGRPTWRWQINPSPRVAPTSNSPHYEMAALNIIVGVFILVIIWLVSESLIKRFDHGKNAENESSARRKPRFQIHLSTAIVLMFVGGGLIWANTKEHADSYDFDFEGKDTTFMRIPNGNYGWPCEIFIVGVNPADIYITNGLIRRIRSGVNYSGVVSNLGTGLLILAAVWFVCEWIIRRRAKRRDDSPPPVL